MVVAWLTYPSHGHYFYTGPRINVHPFSNVGSSGPTSIWKTHEATAVLAQSAATASESNMPQNETGNSLHIYKYIRICMCIHVCIYVCIYIYMYMRVEAYMLPRGAENPVPPPKRPQSSHGWSRPGLVRDELTVLGASMGRWIARVE